MRAKPIPHLRPVDRARFFRKIDVRPGDRCWLWTGAIDPKTGYGAIKIDGSVYRAHRIAYFLAHGELDSGATIDHLCSVRACVRPDHLEAVSHAENIRRALSGVKTGRSPHCRNGHLRIAENTSERPTGFPRCLDCERDRRAQKRAA